jgi:hypothetical protein
MKAPGVGDRPQDEPRLGGPTFDGKLFRGRRFAQVRMVPVNEELSNRARVKRRRKVAIAGDEKIVNQK